MASLREYFDTDFPHVLNVAAPIEITGPDKPLLTIQARLHYDFDSGAKFISYYIPETDNVGELIMELLKNPAPTLGIGDSVEVLHGFQGEPGISSKNLTFVNRFFVYSENSMTKKETVDLQGYAKQNEIAMTLRGPSYAKIKSGLEKPLAFISHDSRDKDYARELAIELQKIMCPVWFDEFTLNVGDSLRESIEKGIKECAAVVVVLSPHFLANPGWTKVEFNSIFTRELVEGQNLILPVWKGVGKKEVFDYSPTLLDRLALRESEGIQQIASRLRKAIFKSLE